MLECAGSSTELAKVQTRSSVDKVEAKGLTAQKMLPSRWSQRSRPQRCCRVGSIFIIAACALNALRPHRSGGSGPSVLVGVFTAYGPESAARRRAILDTWLSSPTPGIESRFVIGREPTHRHGLWWTHAEVQQQCAPHRVLHIPSITDTYSNLPLKTAAFIAAVVSTRVSSQSLRYIIKVDDDVYFRPAAVPVSMARWTAAKADYIGCLKSGLIETRPGYKWTEPKAQLFGDGATYPLHAWGSAYAISAPLAVSIAAMYATGRGLRFLANEDVSTGVWALALGARFLDDHHLCAPSCAGAALAVWDYPACTGLCHPETAQRQLHALANCTADISPLLSAAAEEKDPQLAPFYSTLE